MRQLRAENSTVEASNSGIAKSIEAKAVEDGLTKNFDKVAGYEGSTIKEQAKIFIDTVGKSLDETRQIIRGEKPLPDKAKGFPFIVAMEDYIKRNPELNKNGELSYELANSPLTSAASEAASELGLGQNREHDSFTARTREIQKAREAKVKDVATKKTSFRKQVKAETDKINLSEADLGKIEKFVDSIIC